eukprot:14882097-Alexandrium_andersonii.AAC.1
MVCRAFWSRSGSLATLHASRHLGVAAEDSRPEGRCIMSSLWMRRPSKDEGKLILLAGAPGGRPGGPRERGG